MKTLLYISVIALIALLFTGIDIAFSTFISILIFIYGYISILLYRYFAAPEPYEIPLPYKILNPDR